MNGSSKSNGSQAANCGSSCIYELTLLFTRHMQISERHVFELECEWRPNFAGDVGVLSLLVGQFRHAPFAFAFA